MPLSLLKHELANKKILNDFIDNSDEKTSKMKVLLLSSAYNGLTQRIDRVLKNRGYEVEFQAATTDDAMKKTVSEYDPDLILCPTLMKAIPEEIYMKKKCIIVHPGIKGDRGPSSIDWAILNKYEEWGVTLL